MAEPECAALLDTLHYDQVMQIDTWTAPQIRGGWVLLAQARAFLDYWHRLDR